MNQALEAEEEDEGEIDDQDFMRHEFESIMKERFLNGEDGEYVDYDRIDNDSRLDDDLAKLESQDKEDEYFESVE